MTAVDRAADIIGEHCYQSINDPFGAAKALVDAGLLVTDEMRAVLDAIAAYDADPEGEFEDVLTAALPYLAARPS